MAEIVKTPDQAILQASLARLRQGGGTEHPDPQPSKNALKSLFPRMEAICGARDLHAAPSMALFAAMAQSPEAFEAACASASPEMIERTFAQAMAACGIDLDQFSARGTKLHYTPLQMAIIGDQWQEARSLLARGANPNLFNAEVTPIGMAAYIGAVRCLSEMMSFGANATLYLLPEHAPGAPSVHGSTLLHRVSNRPIGVNKKAVILMLAHDEASYPDPQPKTLHGETPLDWAQGDSDAALALVEAIAGREAKDLDEATHAQGEAHGSSRLRV